MPLQNQPFPLFSIGRDSYIVSGMINSSIEHSKPERIFPHNIHIGRHVSIAKDVDLCVGSGHDYCKIFMGNIHCLGLNCGQLSETFHQRGQILILNDVWFGHGVTVMAGVTVGNGAVVAANSHVVKDVPPYAIVGGNPARLIRYRFPPKIIRQLQTIKWWHWSEEKLQSNKEWFERNDVEAFCDRFYAEAIAERNSVPPFPFFKPLYRKKIYLYFLDLGRPFSLWKRVLDQFMKLYGDKDDSVLLTVMNEDATREAFEEFRTRVEAVNHDALNVIVVEKLPDERTLFRGADFFIANRDVQTVRRADYCLDYGVKILSAVDEGVF